MALRFELYHKAQNTGPNSNLTIGTFYRVQEIQTTTDESGNINYDLPDVFNEEFVTLPGEFKVRVTDTGTLSTYDGEPFTMFAETSITDIVSFTDLVTGVQNTNTGAGTFEDDTESWYQTTENSPFADHEFSGLDNVTSGTGFGAHQGTHSLGFSITNGESGIGTTVTTKDISLPPTTATSKKYFTFSIWKKFWKEEGGYIWNWTSETSFEYSLDGGVNWYYLFYSTGSADETADNSPYWGQPGVGGPSEDPGAGYGMYWGQWNKLQIGGLAAATCAHSGELSNPGYGVPIGDDAPTLKLRLTTKTMMDQNHHYYLDDYTLTIFDTEGMFPTRGFIHNHGDEIRTSFGPGFTPVTYQHIDRKHFWGPKDVIVETGEVVSQADWNLENTTLGYDDSTTVALVEVHLIYQQIFMAQTQLLVIH